MSEPLLQWTMRNRWEGQDDVIDAIINDTAFRREVAQYLLVSNLEFTQDNQRHAEVAVSKLSYWHRYLGQEIREASILPAGSVPRREP